MAEEDAFSVELKEGDSETKLCVTVDEALIHSVLSGEWSDCE